MTQSTTYDIDTDNENDIFVIWRRVFWHADDLAANLLHRRRISTSERRLLDALYDAAQWDAGSLTTSQICDLVPSLLPQTATSILGRLDKRRPPDLDPSNGADHRRSKPKTRDEGLVAASVHPDDKKKRWSITETGVLTREAYCTDFERQFQVFYDSRRGRTDNPLLDRVPAAVDYVRCFIAPCLTRWSDKKDKAHWTAPASLWSGLRRVHLYLSDSLYDQMQGAGIGRVERRVLDAIGYGRKHGFDGLNLGTICRLNDALTRPIAQTAVHKMTDWGWLEQHTSDKTRGAPGRITWRLTDAGNHARESYKRRTLLLLREVFDPERSGGTDLGDLILAAHEHRDGQLLPGLEYLRSAA